MLGLQKRETTSLDMQKNHLLLMRHFSTQNTQFGIHDRDRSLIEDKAQEELDFLKQHCLAILEKTTFVFCSNTKRTKQTLEGIMPFLSPHVQIQMENKLYCATLDEILDLIRSCDLEHHTILVLAHNPGIGCFLQEVQKKNFNTLFSFSKSFPVGGIALFENESTSWIKTTFSSLKLLELYHSILKSA